MTSVLLVETRYFGSATKAKDNKLISHPEVSENQAQQDHCMVVALQKDIKERFEKDLKAPVIYISLNEEPLATRGSYDGKTDALFVGDSISIHHFTNAEGKITRRLVFVYPMTFPRRGELPKGQMLNKMTKYIQEGNSDLELVDLQGFEKDGKFLEGLGALNFSHNGEFVYMALSGRSNEEVLDVVCSKENLNIPEEKRFIFTAVLPRLSKEDGKVISEDVVCHTSLVGWCGKGICAWGFEFLRFSSEEKQEAFYQHIEVTYKKIINLSADEIRAFAGNAYELPVRNGDDERRVLCISDSAIKALSRRNLKVIEEWYGRENIFIFYADVVERRAGKSIRPLISAPIIHGDVLPAVGEKGALEISHVDEKLIPTMRIRR